MSVTHRWNERIDPPHNLEVERMNQTKNWRACKIRIESLDHFVRLHPEVETQRGQCCSYAKKLIDGDCENNSEESMFWGWLRIKSGYGDKFDFTTDGKLDFHMAQDYYTMWKLCTQWMTWREQTKGIRGDNGWWRHGIRIMARYQYFKMFAKDNWTNPKGKRRVTAPSNKRRKTKPSKVAHEESLLKPTPLSCLFIDDDDSRSTVDETQPNAPSETTPPTSTLKHADDNDDDIIFAEETTNAVARKEPLSTYVTDDVIDKVDNTEHLHGDDALGRACCPSAKLAPPPPKLSLKRKRVPGTESGSLYPTPSTIHQLARTCALCTPLKHYLQRKNLVNYAHKNIVNQVHNFFKTKRTDLLEAAGLSPLAFSVDHVISKGTEGLDIWYNLVLMEPGANSHFGDRWDNEKRRYVGEHAANIANGVHAFYKRDQYQYDFSKFNPVTCMM